MENPQENNGAMIHGNVFRNCIMEKPPPIQNRHVKVVTATRTVPVGHVGADWLSFAATVIVIVSMTILAALNRRWGYKDGFRDGMKAQIDQTPLSHSLPPAHAIRRANYPF